MIFCNKMDKTGADFYRSVEMIKTRLGATAVVMQLPIGAETEFKGVIDLIEMNALIWRDESLGAQWDVVEIPEDMKAKAEEYREKLIETVVEIDEEAMEAYLEGNYPDNEKIRSLVRRGTIDVKFHPMFCGTAFKNKGVQPLLDAVVDYLPSPLDIPAIKGIDFKTEAEIERHADDSEPLSMLAFKIMNDPSSVRSPSHVSTRASSRRAHLSSTRSRTSASASAVCFRCTPTAVKTSKKPLQATSLLWLALRKPRRATRFAIR